LKIKRRRIQYKSTKKHTPKARRSACSEIGVPSKHFWARAHH
jgi:hypothetical protein